MSNKFFTDYFKFMQAGMESVNYDDLIAAAKKIRLCLKEEIN
jgi:hypothetical protein